MLDYEAGDEYKDDGLWPCSKNGCGERIAKDGDYCEACQADIVYYAHDQDDLT